MRSVKSPTLADVKSLLHLRKMMALSLLFSAVGLTACQSPRVQYELVTLPSVPVPRQLVLPTSEPSRPPLAATQRNVALLLEDFRESLNSCNADKAAIAAILFPAEKDNE